MSDTSLLFVKFWCTLLVTISLLAKETHAQTLRFDQESYTVIEHAGNLFFAVELENSYSSGLTIFVRTEPISDAPNMAVTDIDATECPPSGADYATRRVRLTINRGDLISDQGEVPICDDDIPEEAEIFNLAIERVETTGLNQPITIPDTSAQVTIQANDSASLSLRIPERSVEEGETISLNVSAIIDPENPINASYTIRLCQNSSCDNNDPNAPNSADPNDYSGAQTRIEPIPTATETETINIVTVDDTIIEGEETLWITIEVLDQSRLGLDLKNERGGLLEPIAIAIEDNDTAIIGFLLPEGASEIIVEEGGNASLVITTLAADGSPIDQSLNLNRPATLQIMTEDGSAIGGTDLSPDPVETEQDYLTLNTSATIQNMSVTLFIETTDDALLESEEILSVMVSSRDEFFNQRLLQLHPQQRQVQVRILDNDQVQIRLNINQEPSECSVQIEEERLVEGLSVTVFEDQGTCIPIRVEMLSTRDTILLREDITVRLKIDQDNGTAEIRDYSEFTSAETILFYPLSFSAGTQIDSGNPAVQNTEILIVNDEELEGRETFLIELEESELISVQRVGEPFINVTIIDDDFQEIELDVSITSNENGRIEIEETAATFLISLGLTIPQGTVVANADVSAQVEFLPSNAAILGQDFQLDDATLEEIQLNQLDFVLNEETLRRTLFLSIEDDTTVEESETLTVRVSYAMERGRLIWNYEDFRNCQTGAPIRDPQASEGCVEITIIDNDSARIGVLLQTDQGSPQACGYDLIGAGLSVAEGERLRLSFCLESPISSDLMVEVTISSLESDNPDSINDYAFEQGLNSVIFQTGEVTHNPSDLQLIIEDRNAMNRLEPAENFIISLKTILLSPTPIEERVSLVQDQIPITFLEQTPPQWRISGTQNILEGSSALYTLEYTLAQGLSAADSISITLTLAPPITESDLSLDQQFDDFSIPDGVSAESYLYQILLEESAGGNLDVIRAGETSVRVTFFENSVRAFTFRLGVRDDNRFEGSETFEIILSDPQIQGRSICGNVTECSGGLTPTRSTIQTEIQETPRELGLLSQLATPVILRTSAPIVSDLVKDQVFQVLKERRTRLPRVRRGEIDLDVDGLLNEQERARLETESSLRNWNVWVSGRWTTLSAGVNVDLTGNLVHIWSGLDYRMSENSTLGLIAGYEESEVKVDEIEGVFSGTGYGGGVYGGLSFADSAIIVDANLVWMLLEYDSQTNYDPVAQEQNALITSTFTAQRVMAAVNISGTYASGALTVRPSLSVLWANEWQEGYRNIPEQEYNFTQVLAGPEVRYRLRIDSRLWIEPFVEVKAEYTVADSLEGVSLPNLEIGEQAFGLDPDQTFDSQARGGLSLNFYDVLFEVEGTYMGLLADTYSGISAQGAISYRWGRGLVIGLKNRYDRERVSFSMTMDMPF